jgi:uncharacterized protein
MKTRPTLAPVTLATLAALAANVAHARAGVHTRAVAFDVEGSTLRGTLFAPAAKAAPKGMVIVTGSWSSVKEQNPAEYARRLAAAGYQVLTFDHRGFGQSDGAPRFEENPLRKVADIRAAAGFALTVPGADPARLFGLGLCAGGGYMARAVAEDPRFKGKATVAGWYTDRALYESFFGAAKPQLVAAGAEARRAFERDGQVNYIRAVAPDASTPAAMPLQMAVDYYAVRANKGGWANQWAVSSWDAIFRFESLPLAPRITVPALVVHSDNAISPDAARAHFAALGSAKKQLVWDRAAPGQMQFYDDAAVVDRSAAAVAGFFDRI